MTRAGAAADRRGFFGVGIINGKTEANIGSLLRAAHLHGAAFVFTVGSRYTRQASDTMSTPKHVPLYEYQTVDDLVRHLPYGCPLVGVELDPRAVPLSAYEHRDRACYLLGAEDHGLPLHVLDRCHDLVRIETPHQVSMNVACAGSILLNHRYTTRVRVDA